MIKSGKLFLLTTTFVFLGITSIVAQDVNSQKGLLQKTAKEVDKSGKVPPPPGSSNFTKFLENKAKEAREKAEKKAKSEKKAVKEKGKQDNSGSKKQ